MKKSFKRFLSSVLATVMAVAGMSIGMTTTASAAVNSYEYYPAATVVNTNNYFTVTGSEQKTAAALADTSSITNIAGEAINLTKGIKYDSKGSVSFTTTAPSSTVTVYWSARMNQTNTCSLQLDTTQIGNDATSADGLQMSVATGVAAGNHSITRKLSKEAVLYYVRVDEEFSGETHDYKVTGTCNLTSGSFTIGDMTATVATDGTWTATKTASSAPFAIGDTLAVSLGQYDADPASVVLASGADEYTFTAGNINFTQKSLSAIPAGTYTATQIEAGLPNFDISAINGTGGKYTGDIKMILSDTATITVNGKCGSSTAGRTASVSIGSESFTAEAGGSNTDYVFSNVAAGETTLTFTSSNTTFQVASITIAYGETSTESTESTTEGSTESTEVTTESTEATTEAPIPSGDVITDKAVLTATDAITTLTADTAVGQFTLMTGISADKNAKSVEGVGEYGFRIKSNGKTTLDKTTNVPTNRAIKFATSDAANLQVIAMSGSSSAVRDYAVYASDGTIVQTVSASGTELTITNIALPKADTYYIACPSAACNFYSVNVVVGGSTNTATGGKVIADQADSYVFATLSAADMAAASMDVKIGDQTDAGIVNVYESAVINGQLVTAKDLGADYLYVIKVAGTNGMAFDFTTVLNAE